MFEVYRGQRLGRGGPIPAALRPFEDSMLEIDFAELSDVGRVRVENEDYLGHVAPDTPEQARSHGWLFAVADGVGGHEKGEVASRMAIETLVEGFREASRGEPLSGLLEKLVRRANTRVLDAGMNSGMATTLVACALRYDRAVIAHVGDSRCYLVRGKAATLLTRDHTIANEHARLGLLSSEEAAEAETRHILSRSLGSELSVSAEVSERQVLPGDVLLLCSDGLHGALSAGDIASVVTEAADVELAARRLVALANEKDGSDNVTAQVVRVQNVERVGMYRGRPYKLR
ncbi:MAG: serine/threonine-protein phosphatase [Acidobacteria bacterium]|nr:MAG: serine/threonine-protein phosphatase [Acidobacteriota bacterium]